MATVPSDAGVEAAGHAGEGADQAPKGGRARLRRMLAPLLTTAVVAVAVKLVFGPWYLNYDARYALLWARDATRGLTPDFEAAFAPTPHPLSNAWSALALPFGQDGDDLMVWLVLLSFGALVYLAYRLGTELFGHRAVGAVTALFVLTRPALLRDAGLGYQDVPFACLVVGAVIAEARRPRRGTATLVLLAAAGLLRPEAWVLAGLYWLYVARERGWADRIRLAGLVALAPVVWALMDFVVTGDPLHSLHGTSALAETADRRRFVDQVPFWTAQYFGYVLREPLLVAVPLGLVFAYRHARRAALLPLVTSAALVGVFAIGPVFGLPLIGRYIRTPSVLLTVFAALAICGWLLLRPGRERRIWQGAAAVAVIASLAYLPWHVGLLGDLERRVDNHGTLYDDLREVGRSPQVRAAAERCGPIVSADHRPVPYLRWWLDGDPGSVRTLEAGAAAQGRLVLLPRPTRLVRFFYRENFPRVQPPAGYERVLRNRSWRVLAAPGCA